MAGVNHVPPPDPVERVTRILLTKRNPQREPAPVWARSDARLLTTRIVLGMVIIIDFVLPAEPAIANPVNLIDEVLQ